MPDFRRSSLLAPAAKPRNQPACQGGMMQGYVMLARSGGQGGGRPLAGRGVSPPKLFLSGVGWGEFNCPGDDDRALTKFWSFW